MVNFKDGINRLKAEYGGVMAAQDNHICAASV